MHTSRQTRPGRGPRDGVSTRAGPSTGTAARDSTHQHRECISSLGQDRGSLLDD